jgi:hypothetical protein
MDALITATARAFTAGDALGALKRLGCVNIAGDDVHPEWNYATKPRLEPNSERLLFGAPLAQ